MKFEQLAQLEREHTNLIVVEEELPERGHLADLRRQRPDLVIRNVQVLQIGQVADHGWQAHQIVVVQREVLEVVPLPQLGTQVLHVAVDLDLDPRGQNVHLRVVRVIVVLRVVRVRHVGVVRVVVAVLLTVDHDILTEGGVRGGGGGEATLLLRIHDAHVHRGRLHQMVSIRRVVVAVTGEELVEAVGAAATV